MCEQTKRYFSPRLVDYVILVGCRHPNKFNHVTQTPELLRRYPLEDHKDFALPPDVIFFCQPEGCINTGHQRTSLNQTTSFVFTLTEKDSNRQRFGICVNFYRHFSRRIYSSSTHNQQKQERRDSSDDGNSKKLDPSINQDPNSTDGLSISERKRKRRLRNNTLTSICLISHHPFFTRFRECLTTLKNIIDACDERSCAKRTGASRGTSRETVWGILTGQVSECTSSVVAHEVKEIETWILRLLSAPVSIPGKTKILIDILPNHEPMLFALPDHTRFSLVDFPLHLPLELLGVDLCIRVLTLIMLENKVVFQSRDYNALTMSVLAFVALLYPLEYMFPVIPLLPTCMTGAEQLLLIPTPFIIGVPASFFPYKGMAKRKFDDIWIVDLDSNQIIAPRYVEPCFDIPELEYTVLNHHLRQVLATMANDRERFENIERMLSEKSQSISGRSSLPSINQAPFIFGNDSDAADIAARIAMVRFFNSPNILGSFNEHTRTLRLHPRAVVAFQYTSFIRSRPLKTAFIMRLAKTQAVEFFAEWTLCPDNVAFLRVQTGVYDPVLIGDKPKWYNQHLTPIPFTVLEETDSLGQAVIAFNAKSNETDCTPTDESGSDSEDIDDNEDDPLNSCFSSLSDFVSEMRSSDICGEIRENKIYPENQEKTACVEYSTVYKPPEELQIPERTAKVRTTVQATPIANESTLTSSYHSEINSKINSPTEEISSSFLDTARSSNDIDSKSSTSTITSINKDIPKKLWNSEQNPTNSISSPEVRSKKFLTSRENSVQQENDVLINNLNSQPTPTEPNIITHFKSNNDKMSDSMTTLPDSPAHSVNSVPIRVHRSAPTPFSRTNRKFETSNYISQSAQNLSRQQSFDTKANAHIENQQFLKEIVTNIQDGLGIGWLKTSRVKKLMEDENYRNFVLSRLNVNLDKRYADEDEHIEDVKISRPVFKGMATILQAVVQGLEATFENNGVGGMASTFQLFEIAHTHYCMKDSALRTDISPLSERNSPLGGSRESLVSHQENPMTASISSTATSQTYLGANLTSPTGNFVAQLDAVEIDNEEFQNIEIIPETNEKTDKPTNDQQTRPDTLPIGEHLNGKGTRTILCINSIINDDSSAPESINSSRRTSKINHHSIQAVQQLTEEKAPSRRPSTIPSTVKSSLSIGYRYRNGALIQLSENPSPLNIDREYLFETLIASSRSQLWDQMQTWEDVFLDAVAQERDMIGLDQGPAEMMERYYSLSSSDRKRLEFDEDRLLAAMLHNLVGFMLMMKVNKDDIRRKIRRMVGRCHIGLTMSQQINELIDNITDLYGNDIDLKPTGSRLLQKQSFTVHVGTDNTGEMLFMEVWDDCIVLRTILGEVFDRCWFEKLVNMTFCPKTRVICLWRKVEGETQLNKFYTKRCRELYFSIKESMERAASRMKESLPDQDLGGEFPIKDLSTGEGGLLQVCLDGICLIFENEKEFVELEKIRKCTTQKGDVFVLEQFDRISKQTSIRKFQSSMANKILLAFHRVVTVLLEHRRKSSVGDLFNASSAHRQS